jgi:hypothetical protein
MHVQSHQFQSELPNHAEGFLNLTMPDSMLAVFTTGIGLAAVAVAEPRIDPQPDAMARRLLAQLTEHINRAGIDLNVQFDDASQCRFIEQITGQNNTRRVTCWAVSSEQRPLDFTQLYGIDPHALFADQPENMQVRAGFLRISNDIEALQLVDACPDGLGVITPERGAVLSRSLG